MTPTTPIRPALAYRVAITGARALAITPALTEAVTLILRHIAETISCCATHASAHATYAPDPPVLRLISPLAEGADRLVANIALSLGYRLESPLPFETEIYRTDFKNTVPEFNTLLAHAAPRILELDGGRDDKPAHQFDESASYQAVGRTAVRNADLVITLWDGAPAKGLGGTADIVAYTAHNGPKLWWIDLLNPTSPTLIDNAADLRFATARKKRDHNTPPPGPPHR